MKASSTFTNVKEKKVFVHEGAHMVKLAYGFIIVYTQ